MNMESGLLYVEKHSNQFKNLIIYRTSSLWLFEDEEVVGHVAYTNIITFSAQERQQHHGGSY